VEIAKHDNMPDSSKDFKHHQAIVCTNQLEFFLVSVKARCTLKNVCSREILDELTMGRDVEHSTSDVCSITKINDLIRKKNFRLFFLKLLNNLVNN
jgi:hypothetical protein